MANRLFGVTFEPLEDVPVWNPVVKPYAVYGPDRDFLGVYMTDDYARESKRGGAWMSTYRSASNIRGEEIRPIVTNNLNLAVPAEGEPTLLTFDQVETVFHEFGHALHGLMTTDPLPAIFRHRPAARVTWSNSRRSSWSTTPPSRKCWRCTRSTRRPAR